MKLLLDKEPVYLTETVCDGQAEQGVEFDYVLPDYYPDIFKILRCTLTPGIVSYSVSGTQLFLDGVVYIKVLYLSENSSNVNCVEQRFTYSKTIELAKPAEKPAVTLFQKADYCNCRAVSGRRIDVRGAVSCKVRVTGCTENEILSDASGLGVQVKHESVTYCGCRLYAERQYVAREDIETGAGGGIASILSVTCHAAVTDTKIISDKVVIKGEARLKALYLAKSGEENVTEVMEAVVPLSQIMDVDGITDEHTCFATMNVLDCSLEIKQGDDGESRLLGCEITVDCKVNAYREITVSPVSDVYSTDYECEFGKNTVKLEHTPSYVMFQHGVRSVLEYTDGLLSEVYDCRCDLTSCNFRPSAESGKMIMGGQMNVWLFGRDDGGKPHFAEKSEAFEVEIPVDTDGGDYSADLSAVVTNVSYSISGDHTADVQIQISVQGIVYRILTLGVVSEIDVMEDKPLGKQSDYALKLYYAEKGEKIWDIAKRYNSAVSAVTAENDLEEEQLSAPCMLLIPVV